MILVAGRKKVFWASCALMLVMLTGLYSWLDKRVSIQVDGKTIEVHTFKHTVGEVLNENQIAVGPHDLVKPSLDGLVDEGDKIEVIRAFPITVVADGKSVRIESTPIKAGEAVALAGIKLGPLDMIKPGPESMIERSSEVRVIRVTEKTVKEVNTIPYQVTRVSDATLEKGLKRTVRKGQNGTALQLIKIVYYDGQEAVREVLETRTIKEPVNQVVAMGTITSVSRGNLRFDFREARQMVATAYTYTGNRTASGQDPAVGLVAVDTSVIPMGTRLYIEGYGFARAADRGSAIQGDRIDVFMESAAECYRWGTRKVKVYILE